MTEKTKVNQKKPIFSAKADGTNLISNKSKLIKDVSDCMKLLDKAIDMHQIHINYPETATPVSQQEMMELMLNTRSCTNSQLRFYGK